jgi:hypothetical protein
MANKKCSDGFSADGVSGSFNTLGQSQTTGETLIVYYCSGIDKLLSPSMDPVHAKQEWRDDRVLRRLGALGTSISVL